MEKKNEERKIRESAHFYALNLEKIEKQILEKHPENRKQLENYQRWFQNNSSIKDTNSMKGFLSLFYESFYDKKPTEKQLEELCESFKITCIQDLQQFYDYVRNNIYESMTSEYRKDIFENLSANLIRVQTRMENFLEEIYPTTDMEEDSVPSKRKLYSKQEKKEQIEENYQKAINYLYPIYYCKEEQENDRAAVKEYRVYYDYIGHEYETYFYVEHDRGDFSMEVSLSSDIVEGTPQFEQALLENIDDQLDDIIRDMFDRDIDDYFDDVMEGMIAQDERIADAEDYEDLIEDLIEKLIENIKENLYQSSLEECQILEAGEIFTREDRELFLKAFLFAGIEPVLDEKVRADIEKTLSNHRRYELSEDISLIDVKKYGEAIRRSGKEVRNKIRSRDTIYRPKSTGYVKQEDLKEFVKEKGIIDQESQNLYEKMVVMLNDKSENVFSEYMRAKDHPFLKFIYQELFGDMILECERQIYIQKYGFGEILPTVIYYLGDEALFMKSMKLFYKAKADKDYKEFLCDMYQKIRAV